MNIFIYNYIRFFTFSSFYNIYIHECMNIFIYNIYVSLRFLPFYNIYIPFPKGICPKVNVIARLEYELAYYDSAVHRFIFLSNRINHMIIRTT